MPRRHEPHWPPQLTIAVAIALQLTLPDRLAISSKWILPALEFAVLVALVVASPAKFTGAHMGRRRIAIALTSLVSIRNGIALCLLAHYLLHHNVSNGDSLIVAGAEIWLTNVFIFSLWFWELDRGGPGDRAAGVDAPPDFLFPQMTDGNPTGWTPQFLDYLYVSLTNATAFSPTDTMPLSIPAKMTMGFQSLVSLVTLGLIISRAVNIL